jgi:ribose 5-phosphate isomerase B
LIFLGADHRGYELKEKLKKFLEELGHDYEDMGAFEYNKDDDYVDYASKVAEKVAKDPDANRGILICRNGAGMDIVANKFKGTRSVLGFNAEQVRLARNDDNINILTLPSDFVSEKEAKDTVEMFLDTPFEGHERFVKRLNKIKELEK